MTHPYKLRTLVVLHQGALGDFLLALSVIQALRDSLGAERVVVMSDAPSARLAAGRSVVDVTLAGDDVGFHTLFHREADLDRRLAERLDQADQIISWLSDADHPLHQRLCASTSTPARRNSPIIS